MCDTAAISLRQKLPGGGGHSVVVHQPDPGSALNGTIHKGVTKEMLRAT